MSEHAGQANTFVWPWVAACALVVCASGARAQETRREDVRPLRPAPVAAARSGEPAAQRDVSENFELNIAERRITELNFFASTAIATGEEGARGLDLRVGVAVGAERIDVTLRNVRGSVRFRGSLDALRRVLDARRPPETNAPRDVP